MILCAGARIPLNRVHFLRLSFSLPSRNLCLDSNTESHSNFFNSENTHCQLPSITSHRARTTRQTYVESIGPSPNTNPSARLRAKSSIHQANSEQVSESDNDQKSEPCTYVMNPCDNHRKTHATHILRGDTQVGALEAPEPQTPF